MKPQTILKKTVKIACVTSVALGGAALVASGTALKAMREGAKFLKNTVVEIVNEPPETVAAAEDSAAVEAESLIAEETCDL